MSEIERIRGFLRIVRRRAFGEALLRLSGFTLAVAMAALLVLALCASQVGPATFWPKVTVTVLIILTLCAVAVALLGPFRKLGNERGVATLVGRRHPAVASDLLSAIELYGGANRPPRGASASFTQAFFGVVASAVGPLDVRRLVPFRPAVHAALAFGALALLLLLTAWLAPERVGRGLDLLWHTPTRFEGSAVSREPLLADVRLSYTFPTYTGLPPRVVEGSTGDIVGLRGTLVVLEAKLLRRAGKALVLLGEAGEKGERPVTLAGDRLTVPFSLEESGSYRLWLAPTFGRPVREDRAHRIVVQPDHPPRVEIFGPDDRLELLTPRPIEVGFSAADDFGLGPVELVYRIDQGPEKRVPLKQAEGVRSTQGRTVFEPNLDSAGPGATVAYRVEATDNDGVSGPKVGSSRTLYVVVADPRESLDEQLQRERAILEKLLDNLADRLEALDNPPARAAAKNLDLGARLSTWLALHEVQEAQVAALGRVVDDERRSGSAAKTVLASLSSIADRLARNLREESSLLAALRARADRGGLGASHFDRLYRHGAKHVLGLETSVLLLDDLIGRQRLEDLADMAKSLTDSYERLQDLLSRYQATKDEELRRQLEQEIRDLQARIQQLAEKIAALKSRNEVPTEWQNMPNLSEALNRAQEFSELLEKGDEASLQKALGELAEALSDVRNMLDGNADAFGETRFAQESKAMNETRRKIGDLEGDERALAADSNALAREVDKDMAKDMAEELDAFVAETREKLSQLKRRLGQAEPRELSEDGGDELKRARESAEQLERLLPDHEFGEAKSEAKRAVSSLRRLGRELEQRAKAKRPQSNQLRDFGEAMDSARKLAGEIASDLDKLTPDSAERMSAQQRGQSQGLSQRQRSLGQRAKELAQEAEGQAQQAPGLDGAAQELREISEQIGRSQQDLARGDPREGSGKARDAADRLARLRDELGKDNRSASGRNRREPVRIPGANESRAPREWRQELMEAMREEVPAPYADEVRKYYEELVK